MTKFFHSILSLLAAGSVLFCGGGGGKVKDGVQIDGVDLGGLPYAVAEERVRERCEPAYFTVRTDGGERTFLIDRRDNVSSLVRKAKKGQHLTSEAMDEWVNAESDVMSVCREYARDPVDAKVFFTKSGEFFYTPERAGVGCSYEQTLKNALAAMKEEKRVSQLVKNTIRPEVTVKMLKERTQKLSSFTTYFDGENAARSHNIALACSRISGTVLAPGDTFSFNAAVGKRTEENGFQIASVIFDGEFVPGVGGGVCQASTTLMNCAVRAGLNITESRAHSLSVSYVPPSQDAMVSEYSDLKFENPFAFPVYIAAQTGSSYVKFTAYGLPDGNRYVLESNVLLHVEPPPEKIVEGDEEKIVRQAKEGIASESYLAVYRGDTLVSRTLFRRDSYAVVQGIRQVKKTENEQTPQENVAKNEKISETP